MNKQTAIVVPDLLAGAELVPLDVRAERIRGYVNAARTCIIQAGRELIAARSDVAGGDWVDWLKREFDWGVTTAYQYMNVAKTFGFSGLENIDEDVTITREALYALAASEVPQEVRVQAIERAQAGEHISKAEAEQMIADATTVAVQEAIENERMVLEEAVARHEAEADRLRQEIAEAEARVRQAVESDLKDAEETLGQLQEAYEKAVADRNALTAESQEVSEDKIISLVRRLSKKRPSKLMLVALATALGRPIRYRDQDYEPVAQAALGAMRKAKAASDEHLEGLFDPNGPPARWHKVLMALRVINDLDPVERLFGARYDGFDHAFCKELPNAAAWMNAFAKEMENGAVQPDKPSGDGVDDQGAAEGGKRRSKVL